VLDERPLHGVKVTVLGQSFCRDDLGPVVRDGEGQATVGAFSVEKDGTRAALAVVAALLRAGLSQSFPERVKKRRSGVSDESVLGPVHLEYDLSVHGPPFPRLLIPSDVLKKYGR